MKINGVVLFDMDDTLLMERFIYKAAGQLGFERELLNIILQEFNPTEKTRLIAKLLKGFSALELKKIANEIPIVSDAVEVIDNLKKAGYIIYILSDSYDLVVEQIKIRVGADFAIANELEIIDEIATGEVSIPSVFLKNNKSVCEHEVCKTNALLFVAEQNHVTIKNCICIGDSEADICMVKHSGIGISFCTKNQKLKEAADYNIEKSEFKLLLEVI